SRPISKSSVFSRPESCVLPPTPSLAGPAGKPKTRRAPPDRCRRCVHGKPPHPLATLLRARCERPRGRAAKQCDERAPSHGPSPKAKDYDQVYQVRRCIAAKAGPLKSALGLRLGHLAMSAQCPVCPKADVDPR